MHQPERKAQVLETRRLLEERSAHLMQQNAIVVSLNLALQRQNLCALILWSMLPVELLQFVLARLPLPEIMSLQVLSKTWVCAEANLETFALASEGNEFLVIVGM